VHLTIFGEVSYPVFVVSTWKVHGISKIYPITRPLASLDAQPVGSAISLHYLGCPSLVRVDRGCREEFPGVCHRGTLELVKESRQGSIQ
jgi:hypothetical protein